MVELLRRHKWIIAAALAAVGTITNYFSLSLFLGVDMLFGNAAALIALVLLGPGWALFVSAAAASVTYFHWHHPYAFVIFLCETLTVALLRRRCKGNLPVADALYWLFIGYPLGWALYRYVIGVDSTSTTVVMLKQALNGIVNALIATLVILFWSVKSASARSDRKKTEPVLTLSQHVFTTILASITIASVIMMTLSGRNTIQTLEQHLERRLEAIAMGINQDLTLWADQHRRIVLELANTAGELGLRSTHLQDHTRQLSRMTPDFYNMYVADANATAVAFYPPVNALGEKTIGQNFADRPYFRILRETHAPTVSSVFMGRGGIFNPIVTLSAPILRNGEFKGYALGALNLNRLSQLLDEAVRDMQANATLVSAEGKVIASTRPGVEPLDDIAKIQSGSTQPLSENFYQRVPDEKLSPVQTWGKSSYGWTHELKTFPGWKLIVEAPAAPHLAELYDEYIRSLIAVLALLAVAMVIALIVTKGLSMPITTLAEETRDLPEKLTRNIEPRWPKSTVTEIQSLIENFQTMAAALRARFEELRRTDKLKDQFLANLSHELRTPLNVIHGYSEILIDEGWSEEAPNFLGVINRNVRHLSQLIDDLLDLSRVVAGKLAMSPQLIDLREAVESSVLSARISAEAKGLRLTHELEQGLPPIMADPSRIHQVMTNLLSNSIKFTPSGGEIHVSLKRTGDFAEIAVRDTGIGMSKEFLAQAFVRFVQEDGASTRPHGGLGIGLSIVSEIVLAHGGTITAQSEGRDTGTTMTVRLPLAAGR
jgi:signal transduction histidine kinase